jgi:broad specificity phosphatase PhoE
MAHASCIVLVRHGRPDLPAGLRHPISGRDIGGWYRGYDAAGILDHPIPPAALRATAADPGSCVIASDARRARESAARLTAPERVRIEPLLREVGFPESIGLDLRLPPGAWVMVARGGQHLRPTVGGDDAVAASRTRAAAAVDRLTSLTREHDALIVVAHAWFNRFLARELRRRGWRGPRWLPTGYWSAATYRAPGHS